MSDACAILPKDSRSVVLESTDMSALLPLPGIELIDRRRGLWSIAAFRSHVELV